MKIIKQFVLILIVIPVFLLCSCIKERDYFCDIEQVKSVQIVRLGEVVDYEYQYTVLVDIFDKEEFVNRLNNIKHKTLGAPPATFPLNYTELNVIRIEYINGDRDILYYSVQQLYRSGKKNNGYLLFDEHQFKKLISDYMPD